jgi:hypothetical protein
VRSPVAHLQSTVGNLAVAKLLRQRQMESTPTSGVRGNFEIRPAGDYFESEADRMADEALRMGESSGLHKPRASPTAAGQRGSAGGILPTTGEPLPDSLRAHYESRFGHDFSGVRVHTSALAAQSARALGASAYAAGGDIVFGRGQFAPETAEGKQLLAHELAHVVQQDRGQVGPSIQRRLFITADKGHEKDADLALRILEPGSGLTLQQDKKTGEVSVKAQIPQPPSPALAIELLTIINDSKQDAEIHVGQKNSPGYNIEFGAFPLDATDYDKGIGKALVQQVRIDEVAAMEKGVPGGGAFKLAHEIWENYSAHSAKELQADKESKGQGRGAMHDRVHDAAEAQANLVASELIGPGERRRIFFVPIGDPPKIRRSVEDMKEYFLVWDMRFGDDKIFNAHKADRIRVSTYTLAGFDADIIAKIANDMKKNPTAVALMEGFASGKRSAAENEELAKRNIAMVIEMVFQKAHQDSVVSHDRFIVVGARSTANQNTIVVTIEQPSN